MTREALLAYLAKWEGETISLDDLPRTLASTAWRDLILKDLDVQPITGQVFDVMSLKLAARKPLRKQPKTSLGQIELPGGRFAKLSCACGKTSWVHVKGQVSCPACGKKAKWSERKSIRWDESGRFVEETVE